MQRETYVILYNTLRWYQPQHCNPGACMCDLCRNLIGLRRIDFSVALYRKRCCICDPCNISNDHFAGLCKACRYIRDLYSILIDPFVGLDSRQCHIYELHKGLVSSRMDMYNSR